MASTAEVMINAVLKYVGFSREQFDKGVEHVRSEVESFRARAERSEREIAELGRLVRLIAGAHGIGEEVGSESGSADRQARLELVPSSPQHAGTTSGDTAPN